MSHWPESSVFMSMIQAGEVSMQGVQGFQDNTGLTWLHVGGKPSIILVIVICMFACFVHKKQLPLLHSCLKLKCLCFSLLGENEFLQMRVTQMTDTWYMFRQLVVCLINRGCEIKRYW